MVSLLQENSFSDPSPPSSPAKISGGRDSSQCDARQLAGARVRWESELPTFDDLLHSSSRQRLLLFGRHGGRIGCPRTVFPGLMFEFGLDDRLAIYPTRR